MLCGVASGEAPTSYLLRAEALIYAMLRDEERGPDFCFGEGRGPDSCSIEGRVPELRYDDHSPFLALSTARPPIRPLPSH